MERLTDAERLAALLDGRLGERDRAELLARLGDPGEELDVLADAAAVTRELEDEDRAAGVVPITAVRRQRTMPANLWRWVAAAAAAAVLLALAPQAWRALRGGTLPDPTAMVALLDDSTFTPPPDWDPHPGSQSLGVGADLARRRASVRFGARAVALQLAANTHDTAGVALAARDAARVLGDEHIQVSAIRYDGIAERKAATPGELAREAESAAASLDRGAVALGAWAEAARVAAQRHDPAFFQKELSREYLAGTARGLWPDARSELTRVRGAAPQGGATDWQRLEDALEELLLHLG